MLVKNKPYFGSKPLPINGLFVEYDRLLSGWRISSGEGQLFFDDWDRVCSITLLGGGCFYDTLDAEITESQSAREDRAIKALEKNGFKNIEGSYIRLKRDNLDWVSKFFDQQLFVDPDDEQPFMTVLKERDDICSVWEYKSDLIRDGLLSLSKGDSVDLESLSVSVTVEVKPKTLKIVTTLDSGWGDLD